MSIKFAIHKLWARLTSSREIRYLIAGTASEAVEYISFLILFSLTHMLYMANSLSFGLGVLAGFIFHKLWSFSGQQKFRTKHQLIGYIGLAAFNFVMINLLVGYFVHNLELAAFVAKFIAICITVSWTYLASNFIIFRRG